MNRSKRAAWVRAIADRQAEHDFRPWFRRMRQTACPIQLWEPGDRMVWMSAGMYGFPLYNPAEDVRSLRPMRDARGVPIVCGARFDHGGSCPDASNPKCVITFRPLSMFERLMLAETVATETQTGSRLPPRADLGQLARWLARQPTRS